MKILHVLSQVQITGAETYALSLAEAEARAGHTAVFVSDRLSATSFKFIPLPIHGKNTSYPGRLQNVLALKKILRDEKIDIVHSHSRAANLAVHLACRAFASEKIPYVTTVHGRWRDTFAFRNFPCLGQITIAMCPYLQRYLTEDIGIQASRVRMVPNGVDCGRFLPSPFLPPNPVILYIGRSTGQKGAALKFLKDKVFPAVLESFKNAQIKFFTEMSPILPADLPGLYQGASVVIGAGRVVLEAMACGKPAVAIGESSAPGLLTNENFDQAFDSNFGDCGEWNLFKGSEARLIGDFKKVLADAALAERVGLWSREKILSQFNADVIASQILPLYEEARAS